MTQNHFIDRFLCATRIRGALAAAVALGILAPGCAATDAPNGSPRAGAPDRTLVVAAVSVDCKVREVEHNVARVEHWSRKAAAQGAELVLFPELCISGCWQSREVRTIAEPVDGPSISRLVELAEDLHIVIAVGMTERDGDNVYIAQVLLDGDGVIGVHRKSDMPEFDLKFWDLGDDQNVFDIGKAKVGVAICYESVNPMTCNRLKDNGAEIILAPYNNGTHPDELHNNKRPYVFKRVAETGLWYVACDQPSHEPDGKTPRAGAAYVINPEGEIVTISPSDRPGEQMVVYAIPLDK